MAGFAVNDPVAKGPVTMYLDQISIRADARPRLEALRAALVALAPAYGGLETVLAEHLFKDFYTPAQVANLSEYLRRYWFDVETGWWPAFQPIAPIYALGLLQTLSASLAPKTPAPLPIDSYWVLNHNHVEVLNLVSPRQVTLLIATPPPVELGPSGMWSASSQAWVTTRRAGRTAGEIDPITSAAVSGGTDLRVRTFKIQPRPAKGA